MKDLQIIFEDENLIAINKPPLILTIPDRFDKAKDNLFSFLQNKFGNIFVVHRLDKETSGIILFAKNPEAQKKLNLQFEDRLIERKFLAIVVGSPKEMSGEINLPILESEKLKGIVEISNHGKKSVTQFNVLEKFRHFALVEYSPKIGRMHQIRIHAAHTGNPIVADSLYGNSPEFNLSTIKKYYKQKKFENESPIIKRCALHGKSISFQSLNGNEKIELSAHLPRDFSALLKSLQKYDS